MELKSGYKQTDIGVIPEEWEAKPLSELGQFKNGINKDGDAFGHGSPFVNLMNVFGVSRITSGDELSLVETTEAEQKTYDLRRGDVLFIRSSVKPSGVGLTAVVEVDLPKTVYSGFLLRFRDNNALDTGFKRHCFYADKFRSKLIGASSVSANTNINQDNLKKLLIALPASVREQRAIATALSDVDGLLDGLGRLIAKKRDLKQAAMQQLLTRQTRLPGFQGEWEVKTFGEVVVARNERIDPKRAGTHNFCIELEHIESGSGLLLGSTSTGTQSSLKSVFHPGDVLFGKLRAYLRKYWRATRQGVCSTEIWVLVSRGDAVTSEFLFQIVQTDDFIDAASNSYGTHMPRSDWNAVQNHELKMPLPPEQTAIAEVLSDMDAELAALELRREKTRALKQAMMQELLTGRTRLV
jgi:type I restriction enzyme S subunit